MEGRKYQAMQTITLWRVLVRDSIIMEGGRGTYQAMQTINPWKVLVRGSIIME